MPASVTQLIEAAGRGDQGALARVMPLIYDELHAVASRAMRRERPGQTMQTTALVNEAYLRLTGDRSLQFQNRAHFMAIAARSMREILVERARARHAAKRGGGIVPGTVDENLVPSPDRATDVVALDEALTRLALLDERQARVVELRFFAGMNIDETAEAMGISPGTVKRDWAIARAWLYRELAAHS